MSASAGKREPLLTLLRRPWLAAKPWTARTSPRFPFAVAPSTWSELCYAFKTLQRASKAASCRRTPQPRANPLLHAQTIETRLLAGWLVYRLSAPITIDRWQNVLPDDIIERVLVLQGVGEARS